ncbi:MAG: hypothetical protein R2844_07795, partial [Caldilineales bacterium]
GVSSWQAMQHMPQQPRSLSLAAAAEAIQTEGEDLWVAISPVVWDCSNIVQEGDRTSAVFSDASRSAFGVAVFSEARDLSCGDLDPVAATGVLRLMGEGEVARLDERGFDLARYSPAATPVALCTFCGRGNSRLGVILGAVMVVIGLSLYPLCLYENRKRARKQQALLREREPWR